MGAFLSTLCQTAVKFVFLGAVAFGGIMCGIKLRKHKDAKAGRTLQKNKDIWRRNCGKVRCKPASSHVPGFF